MRRGSILENKETFFHIIEVKDDKAVILSVGKDGEERYIIASNITNKDVSVIWDVEGFYDSLHEAVIDWIKMDSSLVRETVIDLIVNEIVDHHNESIKEKITTIYDYCVKSDPLAYLNDDIYNEACSNHNEPIAEDEK